MHLLIGALLIALLAALVRALRCAKGDGNAPPSVPEKPEPEEIAEALAAVAGPLLAVMEHPRLGGPGFLTVRFPQQRLDGGGASVTVQFPNISDVLYRRIVRGELDRETLIREGVPEALFACGVSFEAESGGMVLLSARAEGIEMLPSGLRERSELLGELSGRRVAAGACAGGRVWMNGDSLFRLVLLDSI